MSDESHDDKKDDLSDDMSMDHDDFEDLEDISGEVVDESWDDAAGDDVIDDLDADDGLDDFDDMDDWGDDESSDMGMSSKSSKSSKGAGVSTEKKVVLLGVVVIVIFIIGYVLLGLLSGGGPNTAPAPAPAQQAQNQQHAASAPSTASYEAPPQPTPITTAPAVSPASNEVQDVSDLPGLGDNQPPADVLTPFPDLDQTGTDSLLADQKSEEDGDLLSPSASETQIKRQRLEPHIPELAPVVQEEVTLPDFSSVSNSLNADTYSSDDINDSGDDINEIANNSEISKRIDSNERALQSILETLQRLESKVSEQNILVQDRIEDLDRRLSNVKTSAPVKSKDTVSKEKPVSQSKSVAVQSSQPAQSVRRSAPKRPRVQKKSPEWILKSAGPGRAVVTQKGSQDFQTIEVGSSLVGIGRIVSIQNVSGLWVVEGSLGRISQ